MDLFFAVAVAEMAEARTMDRTHRGTVRSMSSMSARPRSLRLGIPFAWVCFACMVASGVILPLPVPRDVEAQLVAELGLDDRGAGGGRAAALQHLVDVLLVLEVAGDEA